VLKVERGRRWCDVLKVERAEDLRTRKGKSGSLGEKIP
jgi:hypothetical protein